MHIRYLNPVATGSFDTYFEEQLSGCAGADVAISVEHLMLPEAGSPFLAQDQSYQGALHAALHKAQSDGCDGAVIGCSGDPGLLDARRALEIPVSAPLEAALHLVPLIGQRVVILVADGFKAHVLYQDLARYYGLDHLISEILTVPMEYPDPEALAELMHSDPDEAARVVLRRHEDVLGDVALELATGALGRGADVVYPGCTFWTGSMLDAFRAEIGAPVIDPGGAAVAMAAAAVRGGARRPSVLGSVV